MIFADFRGGHASHTYMWGDFGQSSLRIFEYPPLNYCQCQGMLQPPKVLRRLSQVAILGSGEDEHSPLFNNHIHSLQTIELHKPTDNGILDAIRGDQFDFGFGPLVFTAHPI